jgi:hypothetical protein
MCADEKTQIDLECAALTVVDGVRQPVLSLDVTLSDEPTLLWQGPTRTREPARPTKAARQRSFELTVLSRGVARAIGFGAAIGLTLSGLAVALLQRHGPTATASGPRAREVELIVLAKTGAGTAVEGATVSAFETTLRTDAIGRASVVREAPLSDSRPSETTVKVGCPPGYSPRDGERVVRWGGRSASRAREVRELNFYCDLELVELRLDLQVLGGEARFRLGDRDLGVTEKGRLRRDILVPSHSEQILRAQPEVLPRERPPAKVLGESRVVQMGESPASLAHTVEILRPRKKSKATKAVPYRL